MKRVLTLILIFSLIVGSSFNVCASTLTVSAKAAILIDAGSGRILYEKNKDQRLPMASTTKIMTALLALESGNLDESFTAAKEPLMVEGTSMGLREGDSVSMRGLCYGMLLSSGNDAANLAATKIGGSIDAFVEMMNKRALELKMQNTSFKTPSGLDAEGHYSTAYDMALLAIAAIKNTDFLEICSQKSAKISFGNPPYLRTLYNHNKLLTEDSEVIGVKTGFTKKSGRCLVSAKRSGNTTLIAVTLNASDDWNDHKKLYTFGFSGCEKSEVAFSDTLKIRVTGGEREEISVGAKNGAEVYLLKGDKDRLERKIYLKQFEYAPITEGTVLGSVCYYLDGERIAEIPLVALECADIKMVEEKISLLTRIVRFLSRLFRGLFK